VGPRGLCETCEGQPGECGPEDNICIPFQDGSFCGQACQGEDDCPPGFGCAIVSPNKPKQCVPVSLSCVDNCAVEGCQGAGEVCDPMTGECGQPKGHCSRCAEDAECGDGGCVLLDDGTYCLQACPPGCPGGSTCGDHEGRDLCLPDGGRCDRCMGVQCEGLRPYCDPVTGLCVECLEHEDCGGGGLSCVQGVCQAGAGDCIVAEDCADSEDGPHCFAGSCVQCITAQDCPPRHRCDGNLCIEALCEGVNCVAPAQCNPENGRCEPSCVDEGCPDAQLCDGETGQCYNEDGTCDGESQCRPGSLCGAGGGFPPGGPEQGAKCDCPTGGQCAGDADCPPPLTCNPPDSQFFPNVCDLSCQGDGDCPEGWSCSGSLFKLCNSGPTYCHPGFQCNLDIFAGGGACGTPIF